MKILIAVEDKLFGEAIADFVEKHGWESGTEFKLVHVVEPVSMPALYGYPSEVVVNLMEEERRAGKSLIMSLGTRIAKAFPAVTIKEEVLEGYPKEVIVGLAEEWPADLIVVGSHGRKGIGRFLLGSVSMSVLSVAPCSVMIVRLPKTDKDAILPEKETVVRK